MKKKMFERLDKVSLLVGRAIVYPVAAAVLLSLVYVPTYAYMHKDDNQMVVKWKNVPAGVNEVDELLGRTDFVMTAEEAKQFMNFVESADPGDMITVGGLRFKRADVGRARYYGRSQFPKDWYEEGKKLFISGKDYACEMVDFR